MRPIAVLRDLPPVDVFSGRFWRGGLGLARWLLSRGRGRRRLVALLDDGLPRELLAPMQYLLGGELAAEDVHLRGRIEAMRRALLRSGERVEAWTTQAREAPQRPSPEVTPRSVSLRYVGAVGSIVPYWGCFLMLCAKALGARTVLELGACAGISSCYLAAAPTCSWFTTIEGSPALARLAESHVRQLNPRARVLNQSFDDALDALLPALPAPLDLVFLDGEHTPRALQHYFERLWPHVRQGGVLLVDDIRWSREMEQGFAMLARSPDVACAVDLGRLGLCVRGERSSGASRIDFSRFTAFWLHGAPAPAGE